MSIQEQVRVILLETYNTALRQIKAHTVTGGPVLAYAQQPGQLVRVQAGTLETQIIGV